MMMEYSVIELDVNGKETEEVFTFQLPEGSTIQDLKRKYVDIENLYEPESLKLCYKQEFGNQRKNCWI